MSINNENSKIPIDISSAAANKVKQLIKNKNLATETNFLRVYVTGGGCSGFQYGFMLDDKVAEDDTKIWYEETGFLVDSLSYQYLCGAVIDYEESLSGSKFIVKNPNAKTTCGCGASFSL